jgi:ribosomal protein S18 acetylase RimI-like enzyme
MATPARKTDMDFELTPEVTDQIIFAMEDQDSRAVVDLRTGVPSATGRITPGEEEHYLPVPDWKPVDGYHLMERFVSELRNPVFRQELRLALASGRGVFRSFKNTLKQSPEVERLWYSFKEREMRQVVLEWYNRVREARGLEALGPEPEETEELVESDFILRPPGAAEWQQLVKLMEQTEDEVEQENDAPRAVPGSPEEGLMLAALTPGGEPVGCVWATIDEADTWEIAQFAVAPAFRGLGLGASLLKGLLERLLERGARQILITLAGSELSAEHLLTQQGFEVYAKSLALDLRQWDSATH